MSREFNYLKLPCLKFKRGWTVDLKLSIVLYSWARPLTSIVPLSNQEFKWVLLIYQGKPMKCLRVTHD